MEQLRVHNYRIPVKHVKRKRIYQFSDTHLTCWDDLSSAEEKEKASLRMADWERGRLGFAKAFHEPCEGDSLLSAAEYFNSLLQRSKEADALILAGDIVDFHTEGNSRFLRAALMDYPIPYMAVCGNHDEPDRLPDGHPMKVAGQPVQKLDLGDMVILGFDNSQRLMTSEQVEMLKTALGEGKPILISMHIPMLAEETPGENDYFHLQENLEFIRTIRNHADQIIGVMCGHLHGLQVSEICSGVTQYVSSQGLMGNLSVYDVGE